MSIDSRPFDPDVRIGLSQSEKSLYTHYRIRMPVSVWHGEADKILPVEQGRNKAKASPNAGGMYFPDQGQALIVNHCEEPARRSAEVHYDFEKGSWL